MEYNDYLNQEVALQVRNECHRLGLYFTIWMTRNFTSAQARQACIESQCDGFAAEAEIPSELGDGTPNAQAQDWPDLIFHLQDLPIQKAVVTNFAPFTHSRTDVPPIDSRYSGKPFYEKAQPLISAGWHCLTECYDLNTGTPDSWIWSRDFYAKQVGWPRTQPVIGCFGGRTLADYPSRTHWPNWSAWSAESMGI